VICVLGGVLLVPLSSCIVAADLLNPDFVSALGIAPVTVFPQTGTIIVTFSNDTTSTARFRAYEIGDPDTPAGGSRNFTLDVPAGEVRNEVLDCPVGRISLGVLDASFVATATNAATVYAGTAATDVAYAGSPLNSGSEYNCGDLISVTLTAQGQETATYTLTIEIIPGR
jgi:hypothetical protein